MLCSTNEAWYRGAGQWAAAGVQVVQEDAESFRIELDY